MFILSAAGYADENSQNWTVFGNARPKTVIVPSKTCYIYAKRIIQGQVLSGRLPVGMPIKQSLPGYGKRVSAFFSTAESPKVVRERNRTSTLRPTTINCLVKSRPKRVYHGFLRRTICISTKRSCSTRLSLLYGVVSGETSV